MPIKIHCSICGAVSPNLGFGGRMSWLRDHRKANHPAAFRASIKKSIRTRKGK